MALFKATPQAIDAAAQAVRNGELVGLPTETVYGLAADATNPLAVVKIFTAKGRPRFNPLIVHVAHMREAREIAAFNGLAKSLAEAFWPGPLTLVLPLKNSATIADVAVAGLQTVAIRMPAHPVARALIEAAGCPVAAPSANISGHVSATTAQHVEADFGGNVSIVLDAGPASHGLESTIVDATGEVVNILRHGGVTRENIAALTGQADGVEISNRISTRPNAPGQLLSHYAPRCAVRLEALQVKPDEALLAFGPDVPQHGGVSINLSPTGNLPEAAANLFAALRDLDASAPAGIAVMPIPNCGIGEAINDRLNRAAAPRDRGHSDSG